MRSRAAFLVRTVAAASFAALLSACAPDGATAPLVPDAPAAARGGDAAASMNRMLAEVRAATAKYHRVEVAIADGYAPSGGCVASPSGAMGVHYVNSALLGAPIPTGDPTFIPTRPEVLVYEPQPNGRMRLVAVEYLIWRAAYDAAHPAGPGPALLGQPFDRSFGPIGGHGLPDHYELHAWLWRHNPNGMFAPWNPNVSCP